MAGAPLTAVAGATVLMVEAAERLGIDSGLVLFGTNTEAGILSLKEPHEPLIRRRAAISGAFAGEQLLGAYTQLAEALRTETVVEVA